MLNKQLVRNINEKSEKYSAYTAENLSKLVRIPSLSCGEGGVAAELTRQMEEAGFDEVKIDGLGNVIGRIGKGKAVLALDAHIDTVDVGNPDNWSYEPFCGSVKDGFVLGRGTVDQKGGAASFVTAGRIIRELGLYEGLTLYCTGTVMEEDCDGLCWKYIVEEGGLKPDMVISTEPTNLGVYRGQRGRMEMEVRFKGLSAHGSAPERGKNAVYMASRLCLDIERLNTKLANDPNLGDPFLGSGSITVSRFQSGSPSLCAVADYAGVYMDRRLTWGETKEKAVAEIEALAVGDGGEVTVPWYLAKAYTGLEYGMEKYYPTWKLPEEHEAVVRGRTAFEELFESKAIVDKWTFSTNGVTINGIYGIPVIGFGPGNEVFAHAPDERVPVSDLVRASAFYAAYALAMAGGR